MTTLYVSGAGNAAYNGAYTTTGATLNGAPVYQLDANHILVYNAGAGAWELCPAPGGNGSPNGYYKFGPTSAPPTGQYTASGSSYAQAPAPVISSTGPALSSTGPDTAGPALSSASAAGTTLALLWADASPPVQQMGAPVLTLTATGGPVTLSAVATTGTTTTAALSRPILAGEVLTLAIPAGAFTDSSPSGANGNAALVGVAVTNNSTQVMRTSSMARASSLQGVYVSLEAANAPGTIVTPAKRWPNFQLMTKPTIPNKVVKYSGSKAATAMQLGQEQSDSTWNAAGDYNLLAYVLASLLGNPGLPTALGQGAYQWTWNVSPTLPLPAPATYSVDQGSARGGERFGYGVFSALQFKWSQQDAGLSGNMFGQQLQRNIAPQMLVVTNPATVTELPVVAVMPKSVGAWLSTDSGATFSRLQKDLDGELRINNVWKPDYHANEQNSSFDDIFEEMPDMGLTFTVEEGTEADTFMQRLYAGQMVHVGMKSIGPLIGVVGGTNVNCLLRVNMPAFVGKSDPGDKGGVYGNAFTFDAGHDPAFGLVQIQLINKLPSL